MSEILKSAFAKDASLLPHMLDVLSDHVLVSRLSEADYKAASFLDQRLITPELPRESVPWEALEAIQMTPNSPSYIFHIGHVGSTLISRLLGELPQVLAVREPHILRSFAEIGQIVNAPQSPWSPDFYDARLIQAKTWLSRTFHPDQTAMIKASSFVSEISLDLLRPGSKALFLYVPFRRYLETIFAGESSRQEATTLASARLMRINKRLGMPIANLWALSMGQKIALGWIGEMLALLQTSQNLCEKQNPANIHWLNFDDFLRSPHRVFETLMTHFNLSATVQQTQALLSGPIMTSYSKAPEHSYSADLRRSLLAQARTNFADDMHKTEAWLLDLAKENTMIEDILAFSAKDTHV